MGVSGTFLDLLVRSSAMRILPYLQGQQSQWWREAGASLEAVETRVAALIQSVMTSPDLEKQGSAFAYLDDVTAFCRVADGSLEFTVGLTVEQAIIPAG